MSKGITMAQYDLRLDIPARSFINANLIWRLERGGTFLDAKKDFFSHDWATHANLDPYNYIMDDQSLAISVLFCTIVVPREILQIPASHQIFQDFNRDKITGLFIATQPHKIDAYVLIKCLRNSVAHALFSIKQSNDGITYEFWTEKDPIFRATINNHNLRGFINIVGNRLTDAVLKMKLK